MLERSRVFTLYLHIILLTSTYISLTCGFDSETDICDFRITSPGSILKNSPELLHSDLLYFSSIMPSILNFNCWGLLSRNQISVSDISCLYENQALPTDVHLRRFSSSVIYLSPENDTEVSRLFGDNLQPEKTRFPLFQNGYPNLRLYTILNWSNRRLEDVETLMKQSSLKFQLNNRLHVITKKTLHYAFTVETVDVKYMVDFYSINDLDFIEEIPMKMYSITNPAFYTKYNFRRTVIRATAVEAEENNPVVTYASESSEPEFVGGLGVFDLWDIRDMLNFTVRAMKGDGDMSVNKTDGLTLTGIGLQLVNDEADVSILHSYHLVENVRYLKPLLALGEDSVYAIFRQPPTFSVRNVFVKPFQTEVWIGLFVTWTVITICVFVFVYLLKLCSLGERCWDSEETGLWVVGALCQRSFFLSPKSISLRFLFIFGLLFSMATYASYSAEILSSLMDEAEPINCLSDLIANKFRITSDPEKFFSYVLKDAFTSQEEYAMELSKSFISEVDSVKSVTEGFVMHFNTLDSLYLFARELNYSDSMICQIYHYVPLGFVSLRSGFYVQKNSPFQEPFNLKIVVIMERGLNRRYIRNYYEETLVKCPKTKKRYREDLGFTDAFTVFAVLLTGMLVSLLTLGIEMHFYNS